jgi:hypothetical protein
MMRGLRILAVGALAAPLLAGCVIYDREARFADGALVARVDSNGCTQASDFEVSIADNDPTEITLRRTKQDLCKALVPDGVELRWTYAELGLEPGTPARIVNPLK